MFNKKAVTTSSFKKLLTIQLTQIRQWHSSVFSFRYVPYSSRYVFFFIILQKFIINFIPSENAIPPLWFIPAYIKYLWTNIERL